MTAGLGKSNAVPVERGEAPTSVFPLQYPGSAPRHMERCLRISPKSSVNDTVADSSYTGDYSVENLAREFVPVDRNALAASIPRWATRFFAAGNTAAIGGLLAVCITQNNHFLLVIAAGLMAAAIGLRAAERAV